MIPSSTMPAGRPALTVHGYRIYNGSPRKLGRWSYYVVPQLGVRIATQGTLSEPHPDTLAPSARMVALVPVLPVRSQRLARCHQEQCVRVDPIVMEDRDTQLLLRITRQRFDTPVRQTGHRRRTVPGPAPDPRGRTARRRDRLPAPSQPVRTEPDRTIDRHRVKRNDHNPAITPRRTIQNALDLFVRKAGVLDHPRPRGRARTRRPYRRRSARIDPGRDVADRKMVLVGTLSLGQLRDIARSA